jgi:YidC/Oxa1 family membrane protein insertase
MDKQSIPLIILCLVLLVFWGQIMEFIWPSPPKPAGSTITNQVVTTTHSTTSQVTNASATVPIDTSGILNRGGPETGAGVARAALENDLVRVEFTSQGGGIERVFLKKHFKYTNDRTPITLNEDSPLPSMGVALNGIPYRAPYRLTADSQRVVMELAPTGGVSIVKEYVLESDYLLRATITVRNASPNAWTNEVLHLTPGMAGPMNVSDNETYVGVSILSGEKAVHKTVADLRKRPLSNANPVQWVATRNQYFTLLVTAPAPFTNVRAEPFQLPDNASVKPPQKIYGALLDAALPPFDLKPGDSTDWTFQVYAGPKEYQRLEKLGKRQDFVMDFGMWELICKVLLWLMGVFHGWLGNWGLAIVAVTVVIKIVFWPLTAISTRSMKQMQALAPKMNALKEKYPNDPRKMNEEMMKMYREYRINPMAGCLPMLIQIPIFFAFYQILQIAVELRGAPFFWWVLDLSQPDTVAHLFGYAINPMPLLMVVTMIWNTLITPQSPNTDPSMKMMMWLMPAMFLWFCYSFSSGLSLYWTVQNLLTILQTYLTRNQTVEPPQKVKTNRGFSFTRAFTPKK